MAFNTNTQQSTPANDSWKAQGFVNMYITSKDGKKKKFGAVPLKDSKPNEKALREFLEAAPANITKLAAKVIFEYQSAVPAEGSNFDLD